eukprot:TRINITY_DN8547_c0_g1_i1.p1 TRINITY_DN8547_c0_g1~~TRINITY_DN8547_c0_g1_i1.p1  ORF type:complete len:524 (-),score=120.08 TRINITY_DN8547_c0_g1_i1:104-1675(-)
MGDNMEVIPTTKGSYPTAPVHALPKKRFLIVEYPAGSIKDVHRALNTLGGEESLLKVCQQTVKHSELRFRPDNPYCHPIYGDHTQTHNFLLKVTTKDTDTNNDNSNNDNNSNNSSDHNINNNIGNNSSNNNAGNNNTSSGSEENAEIQSTEIVGVISNMISFKGLADFQYVPDRSKWKNKEGIAGKLASLLSKVSPTSPVIDIVEEIDVDTDQTIHLPAPIFSRTDTPNTQYQFRPQPYTQTDTNIGLPVVYFDPNQPEVPQGPKFSGEKPPPLPSFISNEIFEKIKELFQKRPIWSQLALCGELKLSSPKIVLKACPYIAYYANRGCWRKCWIRYGYNPIQDPHSAVYQVIDLRVTFEQLPRETQPDPNKIGGEHRAPRRFKGTSASAEKQAIPDHTFSTPPIHLQTLYQICDINDISVQRTVLQATRKSSCDKVSGWLPTQCITKIREIMKARVSLWIATAKKAREGTQNTGESSTKGISHTPNTTHTENTNSNDNQNTNALESQVVNNENSNTTENISCK